MKHRFGLLAAILALAGFGPASAQTRIVTGRVTRLANGPGAQQPVRWPCKAPPPAPPSKTTAPSRWRCHP